MINYFCNDIDDAFCEATCENCKTKITIKSKPDIDDFYLIKNKGWKIDETKTPIECWCPKCK